MSGAYSRRLKRASLAMALAAVAGLAGLILAGVFVSPVLADFGDAGSDQGIVIGHDDDNTNNPLIQPPGTAANQSLNNTDIQRGGPGSDVLIGLLGNDVQLGGPGADILVGGTEQFQAPNSDVQFGETGNDVSVWAPGDGSDFFHGGPGTDAQVFGVIDRSASNVPNLTGTAPGFAGGIPTADVTGSPGSCTLERVPADANLGYEWLVRFFVRASGTLAVTIRLVDVEQVFCTSQAGNQITYADLTRAEAQFEVVSLDQVEYLNRLVRQIIR